MEKLTTTGDAPILKVCGMKNAINIHDVAGFRPKLMGFIFYQGSTRYVGASFKMPVLDSAIQKIGVFVNETLENVVALVEKYGLDGMQLHGDESVNYCKQLKNKFPEKLVLKAFSIGSLKDLAGLEMYDEVCDLYVLDSKGANYGGNGTQWNHELLENATINRPFLLSGGIDERYAWKLVSQLHEQCVGVDINSKFETAPGVKNIEKIKSFINR